MPTRLEAFFQFYDERITRRFLYDLLLLFDDFQQVRIIDCLLRFYFDRITLLGVLVDAQIDLTEGALANIMRQLIVPKSDAFHALDIVRPRRPLSNREIVHHILG